MLCIGSLSKEYDKMTVSSSHGRFNKPSICCARSQLCQYCAGPLVTMCTFFMGCHVVLLLFFTLHVLSIIFSLGAEKQLKPLLTAANSATFPGCVPPRLPQQNMGLACLADAAIPIIFLSPLLVHNMSSPPCSLHPKCMTASTRPSAPPPKPL